MISLHASFMIYDLRTLRGRLKRLHEASSDLLMTEQEQRELGWCLAAAELMIRKIERTGEYIAQLEAQVNAQGDPEAQADLGEDWINRGGDR